MALSGGDEKSAARTRGRGRREALLHGMGYTPSARRCSARRSTPPTLNTMFSASISMTVVPLMSRR
jgi:hypothetical protein